MLACPSEDPPLFRPLAAICAQDPDFLHYLRLCDPGRAPSFSFLFPRANGACCGRCHAMTCRRTWQVLGTVPGT